VSPSRHVTVVGAGIVGISCALYLQRDGHAVTVLDPAGPGEGASKSNAGFLSSGSCVPISTPGILRRVPKMLLDPLAPLAIRWTYLPALAPWLIRFVQAGSPARVEAISVALARLLELAPKSYAALTTGSAASRFVHPGGVLYTYETDGSFAEARPALELRRRRGIDFDIVQGAELRRLEPALAPSIKHGVFFPKTMFCSDPRGLVRALAEDFTSRGGQLIRDEVTAVEVDARGPSSLHTGGGRREVDVLVVAAGAWSRPLAERLAGHVPLETERGYVAVLPRPGVIPRIPLLSGDYSFAITPMEEGLRLAGTVELAGLRAPPNYTRARRLVEAAGRVLGEVNPDGATYSMGFRPSMPDSLPVLARSPRYKSVFLAFGHGHLGLTLGPVTGRIIADLVGERCPPLDVAPFRVDRF
jgi:D-amino-acid dehydrogenase